MLYYVFMFLLELIIFLNNYYNLRCWNSTHPHHQLKYNKNSLGIYVLICIAIYIVAPLVLPIATQMIFKVLDDLVIHACERTARFDSDIANSDDYSKSLVDTMKDLIDKKNFIMENESRCISVANNPNYTNEERKDALENLKKIRALQDELTAEAVNLNGEAEDLKQKYR